MSGFAGRGVVEEVFIALGANLGDAMQTLRQAAVALGKLPHTQVLEASSLYRTAPVDSSGPDYLNAVLQLKTALPAPVLLQALQAIEAEAGRERPYRNAPRTLDLDILLYGSGHIDSPHLQVPHPRMTQRAFVLEPLAEIAPGRVSPAQREAVAGQRIERLECNLLY
jgi:2-amino-4-hydroxy-6-hydroxymethyldihydropteridine diphosphokinase